MDDAMRWGPAEAPAQQLVVLLHGLGADGADLIDLAPVWARALPHAAFVAPHAPTPFVAGGFGRQWFDLYAADDATREAGADQSTLWLDSFLSAELTRLCLSDYALMGFSQGAMMALHAGLRRKIAPKAILAFSGRLIAPHRLAEVTSRPPILLVHGEADEIVPAAESRAAEAALRAEGFDITTQFSPRLGHSIDEAGLTAGALALQKAFSAS